MSQERQGSQSGQTELRVRVRVRLAEMPPRSFCGRGDVACGVQQKGEILPGEPGPDGLPRVACELRARRDPDTGAPNFLGPCAFGTPRERFLYVSWSGVQEGRREMFRRMKVPLAGTTWAQVEEAAATPGAFLDAIVDGIAPDGGPAAKRSRTRGGWRVLAES
jgi:hypothetical protein